MTLESRTRIESDNFAAKDAARFKAKYEWVDVRAIEANMAIANSYAAITAAYSRYLESYGEIAANGRNRILRLIYLSRPARLAQGEIGRELSVTSANVTYLIDGMVRDGLVERAVNPSDRRVTFVELTEKGEEQAERLMPIIGRFMADVASSLSPDELALLNNLINRIRISADSVAREESL